MLFLTVSCERSVLPFSAAIAARDDGSSQTWLQKRCADEAQSRRRRRNAAEDRRSRLTAARRRGYADMAKESDASGNRELGSFNAP
jgi:hypothetical protein